ncbi:MAG TPA: dihydrofolate reductase family protein [Zeimonas sp.]|nr:dihydrofolate reductase family protein [Zeimonas sp.]
MPRVRVECFAVSVDGYGAGPAQSLEHPMGRGAMALHDWAVATRTFRERVLGAEGGETGIDDDFVARGFYGVGAWILGRNMFGPVRGPWPDESWTGWWGDEPPFRCPVFVLTHYARAPLPMRGGTTFHFVTDGLERARTLALEAAQGRDVRIGGGVSTLRQYLRARAIDELHLAIAPLLLGAGESLFAGLDLPSLGYRCVEHVPAPRATHVILRRSEDA